MELDWTTFLLEIANFLILVWIMNRLLYRPVMNAIAARRAGLARTAAEAERLRQDAAELEAHYKSRLAEWEREKEGLRKDMLVELSADRTRLEAAIQASLEQERDKARTIRDQDLRDRLMEMEEIALGQGSRFVTRLLEEVSSPELEERLQELFLTSLATLPAERLRAIADALGEPGVPVRAASAFVCPEERRTEIRQRLSEICGYQGIIEFVEEPMLLAGVQLRAGPWILDATLRGELSFFTEAAHHGDSSG
jgi:F-type H+-transporting ATPase subunit b